MNNDEIVLKIENAFKSNGKDVKIINQYENYKVIKFIIELDKNLQSKDIFFNNSILEEELSKIGSYRMYMQDNGTLAFELPKDTLKEYYFEDIKDIISKNHLEFPIGFDTNGNLLNFDLSRDKNLFIIGSTGCGKSAFINVALTSMISKMNKDELLFAFVDLKFTQMLPFMTLSNMYAPLAINIENGIDLMEKIDNEIQLRENLIDDKGYSCYEEYNEYEKEKFKPILFLIEEAYDFFVDEKHCLEFEQRLSRIVSSGLKTGIYTIMATSCVEREYLKADFISLFSNRIVFNVPSTSISKIACAYPNSMADKLLLFGDMLYCHNVPSQPIRCQGIKINYKSINNVIDSYKERNN